MRQSVSDINISLMTYDIIEELCSLELFDVSPATEAHNNAVRECIDIINKHKNEYMESPSKDVKPK